MAELGHVKRNPASGDIAIRTIFEEDGPLATQAWLRATADRGASFLSSEDVQGWDDLYVPAVT